MQTDAKGGSLQAAATATGAGTAFDVAGFNTVMFSVSGTFVGTVTWQGTIDGTTWSTIQSTPLATGTAAGNTTGTGLFRTNVSALTQVRANITAYTSGSITADARAVVGPASIF